MSGRGEVRRRELETLWSLAVGLVLAASGCGGGETDVAVDPSKLTIALRSPDFAEAAMIPAEFTCDGAGGSPPLEWSGVPRGAKGLALILEDPDAPMGTFSHWVVANLPPDGQGLKASVPAEPVVPAASMLTRGGEAKAVARQGKNDFGKVGYGGPCPPSGTHRYVFRLFALDAPLTLAPESLTRPTVLEAIKDHILAEGRLTGRYTRSK